MNEWASRRKNIYLFILVIFLSGISFYFFYNFWYQKPSCFDNLKNGDETGIDCGGKCQSVCQGETIQPIIKWDPRLFNVDANIWSLLVYVENPNINHKISYLPYKITIYNDKSDVIFEKSGATILPKNKTVGIFEGNIDLKLNRPQRALFEIEKGILWEVDKTDNYNDLKITHTPLIKLDSFPKIEAEVKNDGLTNLENIELIVAIFDGKDNVIASSRTFVDKLNKNTSKQIFFTWNKPFDLGIKRCDKNSDIVLLFDRSGSMASVSIKPKQPLTDAKIATISFLENLSKEDQVSVVSFANNATDPIDLTLTSDFKEVENILTQIDIFNQGLQYTNIFEALRFGRQELLSARTKSDSNKIIILFTDGIANAPLVQSGNTEKEDINYAENLALNESLNIKKDNIDIYTVGLGKNINESFLKKIASSDKKYFYAPTTDDLFQIYKDISYQICKEVPARIEITHKIFGNLN